MDEVAPNWFGSLESINSDSSVEHEAISSVRLAQLSEELSSYYRSDAPFFNLDCINTNLPLFETFLTFKLRIMNEVLEAKSKEELLSISRSISI